jgi:hypothetical protein
MATFVTSAPALQGPTSVGSSATQIFNTTGTPISSPATATEFTAGANLAALTVTNTGTVACWVGTSSVTAATGTPLQSGESITFTNGKHIAAETGTKSWNLYAITASGTTYVEAALATFPSVA